MNFPGGSDGEESVCNAGDLGSIPGSGRSPGEGNGNSLWYSCLDNPMDRGVCGLQSIGSQRVRHDWAPNTYTHTHTICIKSLKIECSNIVIEQDVFECWVNFVGLSGSEIWYFISPSWLVGRIDQIHTIKTSKTLWWTILLYSQSPSGDSSRSLSLLMVTFWGTVFNLSVSHGVFCFVLFCFFNLVQF